MLNVPGIGTPQTGDIEKYRGRDDPEAVNAAARQMESLFLYELLQAMRRTTELSKEGGLGMGAYTTMFDMELSRVLSERGIGFREMLLRGLDKDSAAGQDHGGPSTPGATRRRAAAVPSPAPGGAVVDAGARITSGFGFRNDPFTGEEKFHAGVDLASSAGDAVRAVRPGRVVFSGEQEGYGNTVIVDHGNGLVTVYAHNEANLVKEGDRVDSMTEIARIGSSGRATGPHLHFEVRYRGEPVDPLPYLS